MTTRLEREALAAEIGSLRHLLGEAPPGDVLGRAQLASRIRSREQALTTLAAEGSRGAELSVLFGGRPVRGVESIDLEFASKALERLQKIIKNQVAVHEIGVLPERGPLSVRTNARLAITALEHQSFGFRLEEVSDYHGEIAETPLARIFHEPRTG